MAHCAAACSQRSGKNRVFISAVGWQLTQSNTQSQPMKKKKEAGTTNYCANYRHGRVCTNDCKKHPRMLCWKAYNTLNTGFQHDCHDCPTSAQDRSQQHAKAWDDYMILTFCCMVLHAGLSGNCCKSLSTIDIAISVALSAPKNWGLGTTKSGSRSDTTLDHPNRIPSAAVEWIHYVSVAEAPELEALPQMT